MTKTIKKFSVLIYNADGPIISLFKRIRSKFSNKYEAVDNFVVFMFPRDMEIPGFTGDCNIYEYVGKANFKVTPKDIEGISLMDNEVSLRYISKLIGKDVDNNISYKDLICLIESSKSWQKNII